jgi:hypothetical protein
MLGYILVVIFYGCSGDLKPCGIREPEEFTTLELCEAKADKLHKAIKVIKHPLFSIKFNYECQTAQFFYEKLVADQEREAKIQQDEVEARNASKSLEKARNEKYNICGNFANRSTEVCNPELKEK